MPVLLLERALAQHWCASGSIPQPILKTPNVPKIRVRGGPDEPGKKVSKRTREERTICCGANSPSWEQSLRVAEDETRSPRI